MNDWFILPALALMAGSAALVPLGQQVLRRGVVFIDLAVAQAAAAGSLWTMVLLHQGHVGPWHWLDLAGLAGSLLCAAGVALISRVWPERREALIGLLYVLFACLALLGARLDAHGRDRMLELLAADVLWAQTPPVAALLVAAVLLGLIVRWRPQWLSRDLSFYALFAVVVSLAVPVMGLFVVFALLIGPALWLETRDSHPPPPWTAIGLGAVAAGLGLAASWWWDAPSGPCVALACTVLGLLAIVRRRDHGSVTGGDSA